MARGPVPKRSETRRRRNKDSLGLEVVKAPAGVGARGGVKVPRVSPSWHPLMKDWFRSLKESGQARFYEPSDWQTARLLAEVMSLELNSGEPVKAALLGEFNRLAGSLLTTEGERRRLRVELQSGVSDSADSAVVTVMDQYRELLAGS